jgi:membrane protein YqaA with SNARE-associated domain
VPDAATLGLIALGLVVGAVSAVTPFLPVEAYVIGLAVTRSPSIAVAGAVAAAVGQTAGKLVLFSAARSAGRSRWLLRLRERGAEAAAEAVAEAVPETAATERTGDPDPAGTIRSGLHRLGAGVRRANAAGIRLLSGRAGPGVVLVSGSVGVPPLLAIAFYAGTSSMRVRSFLTACLVGRTVRFVVLALVPDLF